MEPYDISLSLMFPAVLLWLLVFVLGWKLNWYMNSFFWSTLLHMRAALFKALYLEDITFIIFATFLMMFCMWFISLCMYSGLLLGIMYVQNSPVIRT